MSNTMKEEIVNDSYYLGYEGEPEIVFVFKSSNNKQTLKIWNGYVETIVDLMCQYESFDDGILHGVTENAVDLSPNIVPTLHEVAYKIAEFLEQPIVMEAMSL